MGDAARLVQKSQQRQSLSKTENNEVASASTRAQTTLKSEKKKGKWAVTMKKTPGSDMGMEVGLFDGYTLTMYEIIVPGLLDDWNKANPEHEVQLGDLIVEVNGLSG